MDARRFRRQLFMLSITLDCHPDQAMETMFARSSSNG
jgi:hypothetical protein